MYGWIPEIWYIFIGLKGLHEQIHTNIKAAIDGV